MHEVEILDGLTEDEILRLYELFFGPILVRKESGTYIQSLKSLLDKENTVAKVIEKLNTNEHEIIKLLSIDNKVPFVFINEKLSIILGEHPSIIGKMIGNLLNKHFIFIRDEKYIKIPQIFKFDHNAKSILFSVYEKQESVYNHKHLSHIINIIVYLISKDIKFSKSGTLYKKDFETISAMFNNATGYLRDEYNIISFFFSMNFIKDDEINWKEIDKFFQLNQLDRMLFIVKKVFPHLWHVFKMVYDRKKSVIVSVNDFKYIYQYYLIVTEIKSEPIRASFDDIMIFLKNIGLISETDGNIIINYFSTSDSSPMTMKISSSYSIYVNSDTTDPEYYVNSIFADMIKYDKITEFEINDSTIKYAVHKGYDINTFISFIKNYNIELPVNVETTIKTWFEKHNSYYFVEGVVFFCETEEKGKIISKLIESDVIHAREIKKDSVFLVPGNQKTVFFEFLEKSNINFFEKKPKKIVFTEVIEEESHSHENKLIRFE